MISFERVDCHVLIKLKHGIESNPGGYFELHLNQTYKYQAELLKDALNKKLSQELEKIRRESYEQGWTDAKAKRAKSKYFWT